MKSRLWLAAAALLATSSPSFASPIVCGVVPTSVAAAGGGCLVGTNEFTNVSIAGSTKDPTTSPDAIDPTKVQLAFTASGNFVNVILSDSDPASWALTGTQQFDLILTYTVTGSSAYFTGVGDSFTGSATSNANGTGALAFDKTADGVTLSTLSTGGTTSQSPVGFPGAPISTFNVTDNIQVHATNASATLVNATNTFTVASSVPNPVPEPASMTLVASGLAGFIARKVRQRKRSLAA